MAVSVGKSCWKKHTDTDADGRHTIAGIDCSEAHECPGREFSLTVVPAPDEGIVDLFGRLKLALDELGASVLKFMIFCSGQAGPAVGEAMRRVFGVIDWPVIWVDGAAEDRHVIAGIQVFALAGGTVQRILKNGRVVGSVFEQKGTRHCLLAASPHGLLSTPADQARETLEQMQETLAQAGFSFGDVVRTWFYLDDLLSWYKEFNAVRSQWYSQIKFHARSLPASTGIAARNPAGAALVAGAWAVQTLDSAASVCEVASPRQCPAPQYGSWFSRAVEMNSADGRRLLISGTSSIGFEGETVWQGDVQRQIEATMDVVEAILKARGFDFRHLTRATAYFKNRHDIPRFAEWRARRGLSVLPVVATHCGICREELLFELEADAWLPGGDGSDHSPEFVV